MAKITRAQLAQRRRIELYKKVIIYGFLVLTILPILTSVFLLYKVDKLEERLEYALSEDGGDYLTLRQSRDALKDNPNVNSGRFATSVKSVLGTTNAKGGKADNTADTETITPDATEADRESAAEEQTPAKDVKRVYLTFDDGPSIYTGQILDVLAANNVKATFFVIGRDKEYYDYYAMLSDLPKYKDKIGKVYLVVQELVVTDDLEIEAPEVISGDVKPVPDGEIEQLYTDTYNKVFGVNP